ncbi:MAG: hypothetical protein LBR23_08015 [Spirochaetaceae bacterium]|jgi:hypothetical protein|nr:hypothetical protein [Spirochaetaceae bacterium]
MGENERRCADIVLNGVVTEMKTVMGNRETLGWRFKYGYRQGKDLLLEHPEITAHSVFIWLLSDLTVVSVKAKIAGELKNRLDNGNFFCFFERTSELLTWSYQELRAFIRPDKK